MNTFGTLFGIIIWIALFILLPLWILILMVFIAFFGLMLVAKLFLKDESQHASPLLVYDFNAKIYLNPWLIRYSRGNPKDNFGGPELRLFNHCKRCAITNCQFCFIEQRPFQSRREACRRMLRVVQSRLSQHRKNAFIRT